MPADIRFSKSLLDAIQTPEIFPAGSNEAMTMEEWCMAKGLKRTMMMQALTEKVEQGVLEETKKRVGNKIAKAWKLKK